MSDLIFKPKEKYNFARGFYTALMVTSLILYFLKEQNIQLIYFAIVMLIAVIILSLSVKPCDDDCPICKTEHDELVRDRERLEWLEKHLGDDFIVVKVFTANTSIKVEFDWWYGPMGCDIGYQIESKDQVGPFDTFNEAIDAKMEDENEKD